MRLFLVLAVLVIIGQSALHHFQMRNCDSISPEQMYEITLIKNGVAR